MFIIRFMGWIKSYYFSEPFLEKNSLQMQNKEWSYICFVELSCVPVRPSEAVYHVYSQKGGAQMKWQARCIIPDCKSEPSTICAGCTRDVRGIVFVCKPSARKQFREILHQARSPKLLDAQGNEIERPSLIKKGSGTTVQVLSVFRNANANLLLWTLITLSWIRDTAFAWMSMNLYNIDW